MKHILIEKIRGGNLEIGKLSNEELERYVFQNIRYKRKEVLVKSSVGMDTSVLDFNSDLLVLSCDPITGATKGIGTLAVNISCNDVACECAEPVGILMSVLLPPNTTLEELQQLIREANEECDKLGLDIIGGHTEVTDAVNQVVVTTTVIGRVSREQMPKRNEIKPGDIVAVSKDIAIEGTSIIVAEKEKEISSLSLEEKKAAKELSQHLSVLKESSIAKKYNVKYMHDITEGGIYGALWETGQAIGYGMEIQNQFIPLHSITEKLAEELHINPYRLIGSGSMIMVFDQNDFLAFQKECEKEKLKVTQIAVVTMEKKVQLIAQEQVTELFEPGPDELYKVL